MSDVDVAVNLVKHAVEQDSLGNYGKAANLYAEGLVLFHNLTKSKSSTLRCRQLLKTKIVQYEDRLKLVNEFVMSNKNLSHMCKDLQSSQIDEFHSGIKVDFSSLYKNPLLTRSLDLLHRGLQEDEQNNFGAALACYECGLASLLDVVNCGIITDAQQAESVRIKYLMYHDRAEVIRGIMENKDRNISYSKCYQSKEINSDSNCAISKQRLESEQKVQLVDVSSLRQPNMGSSQSLYESYNKRQQCKSEKINPLSSSTYTLNKTHEIIQTSELPTYKMTIIKDSLHSLYPLCEIKTSPSVLSVQSYVKTDDALGANNFRERTSSRISLQTAKSFEVSKNDCFGRSLSNLDNILVMEDPEDIFESELIGLNDSCDDSKSHSSDSGYSDPSPDGTYSRDSKSPGSEDTLIDRKSPFSDYSDDVGQEYEEKFVSASELLPNVIVVNETKQQENIIPNFPRSFDRQQSRFQNPHKDILISLRSQDNLAVIDQDGVDGLLHHQQKTTSSKVQFVDKTPPDVYTRRAPGSVEYIPPRSTAKPTGEHGNMNKGCYYLMAALDFCWCL